MFAYCAHVFVDRTAVKDRIVVFLLFMGKIFITAAVGMSSCFYGYQYGSGYVFVFQVFLPTWGLGHIWMVGASFGEERNSTTSLYL